MTRRRLGVVTGSRADYGGLRPLLDVLERQHDVTLLVTGMHLSPLYGSSVDEIVAEGRPIGARIPSLVDDDGDHGISASIGAAVTGFANELATRRPELLVVYGDRHESFAAVCAAVPLRIPVAHIGGGENTVTVTTDVAYRAAMTKLSHVHFVSIPAYRDKLRWMGEEPWRIHVTGALAVDNVRKAPLLDWPALAGDLGLDPTRQPIVVTHHPVTMAPEEAAAEIAAVLSAIARFPAVPVLFTYPGADAGARPIIEAIEAYCASHPEARIVRNLGAVRYVNLLRHAAAMLGNSSSGILEAPLLGTPVVNVGSRQDGRVRAGTVRDVPADPDAIAGALNDALRQSARSPDLTYGDGHAAERIAAVLAELTIDGRLLRKEMAHRPTVS